jgi:hypothetical protein
VAWIYLAQNRDLCDSCNICNEPLAMWRGEFLDWQVTNRLLKKMTVGLLAGL